jgi:molybdopterin biosynthesis enzyme
LWTRHFYEEEKNCVFVMTGTAPPDVVSAICPREYVKVILLR